MNLSIGMNIRRLRLEKGLTQEDVAEHLGISFQAVSKWERGEGYPDIEILPALSNYFGISIDGLLGVSDAEKKQRYGDINALWAKNNKEGRHSVNTSLMKTALRDFPNDPLFLVQLSTSLEKINGTPEERERNLRESVAVQEQIINFCPDCEVRGATLYNICFAYEKLGEHEKAVSQARKLPNLYKGRENALVYLLSGEEKRETALEALKPLSWGIVHHLTALYEAEGNKEYLEKAVKITELIFPEDKRDAFIERMLNGLKNR